jgi:hypothetical protein
MIFFPSILTRNQFQLDAVPTEANHLHVLHHKNPIRPNSLADFNQKNIGQGK